MMSQTNSCCDLTAALGKMDGDIDLLNDLAKLFVDTLPDRIRNLDLAMKEGSPQKISDEAHSIKGSVRYFLAESAYEAAQHLEITCIASMPAFTESAYAVLLTELWKLNDELSAL